jgi:hypothetical protein
VANSLWPNGSHFVSGKQTRLAVFIHSRDKLFRRDARKTINPYSIKTKGLH